MAGGKALNLNMLDEYLDAVVKEYLKSGQVSTQVPQITYVAIPSTQYRALAVYGFTLAVRDYFLERNTPISGIKFSAGRGLLVFSEKIRGVVSSNIIDIILYAAKHVVTKFPFAFQMMIGNTYVGNIGTNGLKTLKYIAEIARRVEEKRGTLPNGIDTPKAYVEHVLLSNILDVEDFVSRNFNVEKVENLQELIISTVLKDFPNDSPTNPYRTTVFGWIDPYLMKFMQKNSKTTVGDNFPTSTLLMLFAIYAILEGCVQPVMFQESRKTQHVYHVMFVNNAMYPIENIDLFKIAEIAAKKRNSRAIFIKSKKDIDSNTLEILIILEMLYNASTGPFVGHKILKKHVDHSTKVHLIHTINKKGNLVMPSTRTFVIDNIVVSVLSAYVVLNPNNTPNIASIIVKVKSGKPLDSELNNVPMYFEKISKQIIQSNNPSWLFSIHDRNENAVRYFIRYIMTGRNKYLGMVARELYLSRR